MGAGANSPLDVDIKEASSIPENLEINSFLHQTIEQPMSPHNQNGSSYQYRELKMSDPSPEYEDGNPNNINKYESVPEKKRHSQDTDGLQIQITANENILKIVGNNPDHFQ